MSRTLTLVPLDAEQRVFLETIIGPLPDNADERYDALGTVNAVAIEVLRSWRAILLNPGSPESFTIPGDYGQTLGSGDKLTWIDRMIARLESAADLSDGGGFAVSHLRRVGRSRRPVSTPLTQF